MKLKEMVAVVTGASQAIALRLVRDGALSAWVTGQSIEASGGLGLLIPSIGTN
jgi:NAD(P)-dependent dehydrogenase (short-subunit alcohol dehydrogenase family)